MLDAALQKIANIAGIEVVGFRPGGGDTVTLYLPEETVSQAPLRDWGEEARTMIQTLEAFKEPSMRVLTSTHICNVARDHKGHTIIVVTRKGHEVSKSVQRIIRRGFRKANDAFRRAERAEVKENVHEASSSPTRT